MNRFYNNIIIPFFLIVLSTILLFVYCKYYGITYLTFSDGAKFADIARNMYYGFGFNGNFSFWNKDLIDLSIKSVFPSPWVPPLMPFFIMIFFKIFGISDFSVIATSFVFFILSVLFTYILGRKLFGKLVGLISAVAVLFNESLILYGLSGASEPILIFEIVATAYFITIKKKWATILASIFMVLMYFTRPQGFIYIICLILFWLLVNFKLKKAILSFFGIIILGLFVDKFILANFAGKYFLYPILARGQDALVKITTTSSPSDALRGVIEEATLISSLKKIFYNLYNFYKMLPQILSPYLFVLFLISLFYWTKNKLLNAFKISVTVMVLLTFLTAAISIPLFRYLHPIIPLVYIVASEMLVLICRNFIVCGKLIKKDVCINVVCILLIFIFCGGQILGVIFLDSRFKSKLVNIGKPPVYVVLSKLLKENTNEDELILTNLDTWGSWYGNRKTVWYPMSPDAIIPSDGQKNSLDIIYLTSYLVDDENYYMGEEWKQIFLNPNNIKNEYILKNYKIKTTFDIKADDVYENYSAHAILLVKR